MSEIRESVRAHVRYEWDCPACGETHDEADIEPSGDGACSKCGQEVTFE